MELNLTRALILLLTATLAWLTYRSNLLLKEFQPTFNVLLSVPESLMRLTLVVVCLGLMWLSGLPRAQFGLVSAHPLTSMAVGFAIGLVTQIILNWVSDWAISHFGAHIHSAWLMGNILPRRPLEWVLVPLAFGPAVLMEELLFRSLLLGSFWDILPLPLLVMATSILFGLMHQPQGQLGIIGAGSMNILLSLLFIGSGELLVPLTSHYTINLLQVVVGGVRSKK